jgi:hypothetical protein
MFWLNFFSGFIFPTVLFSEASERFWYFSGFGRSIRAPGWEKTIPPDNRKNMPVAV